MSAWEANMEKKYTKIEAKVDKIIEVLLGFNIELTGYDGKKIYPFEELNKLLTI